MNEVERAPEESAVKWACALRFFDLTRFILDAEVKNESAP